jgi:alcohol dehydrogenase class IV
MMAGSVSPGAVSPPGPFRWQDGERLIVFGRGAIAQSEDLLADGYELLTTPRALAHDAGMLRDRAAAVHEVGPGRVDALASSLREQVGGEVLVALGGGRVIDVTKAVAAADPPRRVAAIPTTLSGAQMTPIHRHAEGVDAATTRVRPALVIDDPSLSASQPLEELAASACNALGHAVEGPLTPLASPVPAMTSTEAARLLVGGFQGAPGADPDRDAVALGALLAGYVIGSTGYGLHHVLSQTLVRFAGVSHGSANAIMLPHSIPALARRVPEPIARLADVLGENPAGAAARLCALTGATRLRELGVSEGQLERCAEAAAGRPELSLTPPAAEPSELRELYAAAY